MVAPSIPQRGKLQSLRVFASLRALRETLSCYFVPSRLRGEEKINNKEVVAPSIPQRGKLQSLRVFASLRALRETHSCYFVPSRLSGEEKINNKKVKIRIKEVAVTKKN